jgi:hypothetical protein
MNQEPGRKIGLPLSFTRTEETAMRNKKLYEHNCFRTDK